MRGMCGTIALCSLLVTLGSGQWLERQVVIGDTLGGISPIADDGIVVNPLSGNVYVESNPIQVFNPVTLEKLRGPVTWGEIVFCPASGKGYVLGDSAVILDAAADTVIGASSLPFAPYSLACSPTSNRIYLGSTSRETLFVFDVDGDSILHGVAVGADVRSMLWDSAWNRLYVSTDSDSGLVEVLDCAADTLLGNIYLGSRRIYELALSTVSRKLYCAGADGVYVVSTDSLKPVGWVPGLGVPYEHFVYSPVTDRLYGCAGSMADTVFVVDCQGDTIRARLAAFIPSLAASTLSGEVYLGSTGSAQVLVVDTSDAIVDSVPLPTVPYHSVSALTFGPDRNELYGVALPGGLAFIIDASVDTLRSTLNYAAYTAYKMVHNPAGNKLYVLAGYDEILVLDSAFGTLKHIFGGAYDSRYAAPVLDPSLNRLYVADAGALRVIDCNTDSVLTSKSMYGVDRPRPVMVPYLNKLYVFDSRLNGDYVYAYDCLRDTVVTLFYLSRDVPAAIYDPRSNRVFFACEDRPSIRALDPVTDSVVGTWDLAGRSSRGSFELNLDLGRLYYTDQSPDLIFTIDLATDSVIASESLPWDVDSMFLNRRLGKIFMCSRDTSQVLVLDCGQGTIVDTFDVGYSFTLGLMDDRNDKLYLRNGVVVDCRYDSVVTTLQPDTLAPRSMAWDAIDNRVFQATTSMLYVYRDDLSGLEEQKPVVLGPMLSVLGNPARNAVRLRLQIPRGQTGRLAVYDVAGRLAHSASVTRTSTLRIDLGSVPAGVYFVTLEAGRTKVTEKVVIEH